MTAAPLPFVLADPAYIRSPPPSMGGGRLSPRGRLFQFLDARPDAHSAPDFLVEAACAQTAGETAARWSSDVEIQVSLARYAARHEEAAYLAKLRKPLGSYSEHRRVEDAVADYVEAAGYPKLTDKLRACRRAGTVAERETDGKILVQWDSKCNLARLCPDESGVESSRVAQRYLPRVEDWLAGGKRRRVQKAVFTVPNVPAGGLRAAKRDQLKALDRLLRRKVCRNVQGALVTQEDPLSAAGDWHPHLNVLLLVEGFLDWGALRAEWTEVTRRFFPDSTATSFQIEIRELPGTLVALRAAFREQVKYAAKMVASGVPPIASPGDDTGPVVREVRDPLAVAPVDGSYGRWSKAPGLVAWPYAAFGEWWEAGLRFRRTRAYGVLYGAPKPGPAADRPRLRPLGRVRYDAGRRDYEVHMGGVRRWAKELPVDLTVTSRLFSDSTSQPIPG